MRAEDSSLNDNSKDHDCCASHDNLAPAELVTIHERKARSRETSDFIDCCYKALDGRVVSGFRYFIVEFGSGNNTAHHTLPRESVVIAARGRRTHLVIAKEQEAAGANDGDKQLEFLAPEAQVRRASHGYEKDGRSKLRGQAEGAREEKGRGGVGRKVGRETENKVRPLLWADAVYKLVPRCSIHARPDDPVLPVPQPQPIGVPAS